jgi:hypothetical protein
MKPSHLFPASWWRAAMQAPTSLAYAGIGLVGLSTSGCAGVVAEGDPGTSAAAQQREGGWNVGGDGRPLVFFGAQATDVDGSTGWSTALTSLTARLQPASARWQPFYAPALFQSLQAPRNDDLRAAMRPVLLPEMTSAAARGDALRSLFIDDAGRCRADTAIIVDVPGPESIALAASLAPCFDPVFFFDNWPHPLGVVPSHLTVGAALYYAPVFERTRAQRPDGAPPVFVLDRNRLAPYGDDSGLFDNRYLARLPAAGPLASAGIRHVLYVTPDDGVTVESDDLNDDLVALEQLGIDVRTLALTDFQRATNVVDTNASNDYTLGGEPMRADYFWSWYGWGGAPDAPPPPARLAPHCHFHPVQRPMFTAAFPGGSGFRGVPVGARGAAHLGGGFHGTPPGAARSGSLGRMHFGFTG